MANYVGFFERIIMRKMPSIQQTQPKSLKLTPTPFHLSMTNDLSVQVLGTWASCNRRKKNVSKYEPHCQL